MSKNKLLLIKKDKESNRGKLYNSDDLYPIAMWLGKLVNGYEDESYTETFLDKAAEVYDLAHRMPEWAKLAAQSPHGNRELDLSDIWDDYTLGDPGDEDDGEDDETTD